MKLKTKITHKFDIESDSLDEFEFDISIEPAQIKKQRTKIIEVKKKYKIKQDVSTRLF